MFEFERASLQAQWLQHLSGASCNFQFPYISIRNQIRIWSSGPCRVMLQCFVFVCVLTCCLVLLCNTNLAPMHHVYCHKYNRSPHIAQTFFMRWKTHTCIHRWLTRTQSQHRRMPSLTFKRDSRIHARSIWLTTHSSFSQTAQRFTGCSVSAPVWLNDALLFLRPTRKTPRGPPLWRASKFFCRNSWRANRCRKRWLSLSMRGNDWTPLEKCSLL